MACREPNAGEIDLKTYRALWTSVLAAFKSFVESRVCFFLTPFHPCAWHHQGLIVYTTTQQNFRLCH